MLTQCNQGDQANIDNEGDFELLARLVREAYPDRRALDHKIITNLLDLKMKTDPEKAEHIHFLLYYKKFRLTEGRYPHTQEPENKFGDFVQGGRFKTLLEAFREKARGRKGVLVGR